jgi:hypothetical protein
MEVVVKMDLREMGCDCSDHLEMFRCRSFCKHNNEMGGQFLTSSAAAL